jgi:cobalt-zinc-cadmium efflux system protein
MHGAAHGHAHPHPHRHGSGDHASSSRGLALALALTASFLVVEVIGSVLTGSLALLSDAGHMFTDAGALALALYAQALAARNRTGQHTFGFRRAEILAALLNGTVLGVGAVWVIVEAIQRLRAPTEVHGLGLLVVAGAGLLVNLAAALVLSRGGPQNINVRAAMAHVLSDAAGSVAALVAGLLVITLNWTLADPVASIVISILILAGAWRLVRQSVNVLMEGTPSGIEAHELESLIQQTPGVAGVHDLHVWSVSEGFPVVTVHVTLASGYHGTDVAEAVCERIDHRYGVRHVTVQPEAPTASLVPRSALTRQAAPRPPR